MVSPGAEDLKLLATFSEYFNLLLMETETGLQFSFVNLLKLRRMDRRESSAIAVRLSVRVLSSPNSLMVSLTLSLSSLKSKLIFKAIAHLFLLKNTYLIQRKLPECFCILASQYAHRQVFLASAIAPLSVLQPVNETHPLLGLIQFVAVDKVFKCDR